MNFGTSGRPVSERLADLARNMHPETYVDKTHGTYVAGIICYGDELENQTFTGVKGCMLFDATVIPDLNKERIYEDDLIDNIREVIEKHGEKIKIWNMSLGSLIECEYSEFSDFGIALDNIQDENDVIISKSAGT